MPKVVSAPGDLKGSYFSVTVSTTNYTQGPWKVVHRKYYAQEG